MKWRTNLFFPFLKKSKRKGTRGWLYRTLERIGPVTRCSPVRRTIQIVCLVMFLWAFYRTCWPYSKNFEAGQLAQKETYPVELFLLIDPLVGLSTALAGQFFNWATLWWMLGILAFCILIPRAFCGYFCPLGTLIDGFDWLIGRWFRKWHVPDNPLPNNTENGSQKRLRFPYWHVKYYLLSFVFITSLLGVLTSGFVSAIPVLTRGMLLTGGRWQLGIRKGPDYLTPTTAAFYLSIAMFAGVFLLSLKGRRFWCRYVCPSGALLSVFNFFRASERKVTSACINCNKCIEICPFDAIEEDYTTRTSDCTYCQTCGGVCPTEAIQFVGRLAVLDLKPETDPPPQERGLSRRGFLTAGVLGVTSAGLTQAASMTKAGQANATPPLRPPGSVPEEDFLNLCIRCGECFQVCPGPVLHSAGFEHGIESMWTPVAVPEHAGCHQECNFCTQVCPTGAIQPLDLLVKKQAHMGLAKVNTTTCLPFDDENREDCNLCYIECEQAGYHAIKMEPIPLPVDRDELSMQGFSDMEIDAMSQILAPHVDADACVGCGICTYRCHQTFVVQSDRLSESAITIHAENEHRLRSFPQDPNALPAPST